MSPQDLLLKKIQIDALGEQYLEQDSIRRRARYKQDGIMVRIGMLMGQLDTYEGNGFTVRPAGVPKSMRGKHLSPSQRRKARRLIIEANNG